MKLVGFGEDEAHGIGERTRVRLRFPAPTPEMGWSGHGALVLDKATRVLLLRGPRRGRRGQHARARVLPFCASAFAVRNPQILMRRRMASSDAVPNEGKIESLTGRESRRAGSVNDCVRRNH